MRRLLAYTCMKPLRAQVSCGVGVIPLLTTLPVLYAVDSGSRYGIFTYHQVTFLVLGSG